MIVFGGACVGGMLNEDEPVLAGLLSGFLPMLGALTAAVIDELSSFDDLMGAFLSFSFVALIASHVGAGVQRRRADGATNSWVQNTAMIVVFGGALALTAVSYYSERLAEQDLEDLRVDLEASFEGTTSVGRFQPYEISIDPFVSDAGATPDSVGGNDDLVSARYSIRSHGVRQCIWVIWTPAGPSYQDGCRRG